ncbi:MAG TPA: hypothetical protein VD838_07065 [Anaeromyxobacteraceae bacterium]|nr:hypothetical protein [Anaeromyxobacteraceae bacterium]
MIVAGVVIETMPGEAARVAASLGAVDGLELQGSDGDRRLAGVWTGADGAALQRAAERLLASDPGILGVFPTFVGDDAEPRPSR